AARRVPQCRSSLRARVSPPPRRLEHLRTCRQSPEDASGAGRLAVKSRHGASVGELPVRAEWECTSRTARRKPRPGSAFVTRYASNATADTFATMKRLFFFCASLLILSEAANVYFIMPLPYSQRARSIDVAYFLYSWRWAFRVVAGALMLAGLAAAWRAAGWRKLFVAVTLVVVGVVAYMTNFVMSA